MLSAYFSPQEISSEQAPHTLSQPVLKGFLGLEVLDPWEGDIGPRYWLGLGGSRRGQRAYESLLSLMPREPTVQGLPPGAAWLA